MKDVRSTTPKLVGQPRPLQERVFLALWGLWALFVVTPCVLWVVFSIVSFLFGHRQEWEEVLSLSAGNLLDIQIAAGLFVIGTFCTAVVGALVQFVVLGYGSPLRLLRGQTA